MMGKLGMIAAAVTLLVGTVAADPFTGRYNIESIADQGVAVSGFINFSGALHGTTAFKLGDLFVTDFSIVVSGLGFPTLTYDSLGDRLGDDALTFDAALGAAEMVLVRDNSGDRWSAHGDLGGAGVHGSIMLGTPFSRRTWFAQDGSDPPVHFSVGTMDDVNPAWKLVLATDTPPVPEPGTLLLSGLAVAGALVWRRRKRNEQSA